MADKTRSQRAVVYCIDCGEAITLTGQIAIGQVVRCTECGVSMDVVSLDPVQVDWADNEPEYPDRDEYR
jgi:lysine biosynthesis protein LysW